MSKISDILLNTFNNVVELQTNMCERAFTEVTIPEGVDNIGKYAFAGCSALTKVEFLSTPHLIAENAFLGCDNLTDIYVTWHKDVIAGAPWGAPETATIHYKTPVSYKLSDDGTYYICDGLSDTSVVDEIVIEAEYNGLPVKEIEAWAFGQKSSYKVKSIIISEGIEVIKPHAFHENLALTSIAIPNSVTKIDYNTFYDCPNLVEVNLGNSIISIGDCAFYSCDSLTNIVIPDSVTSIGDEAFYGCYSITDITIGTNVINIGSEAFNGCDNLTNVYITNVNAWCNISFVSETSNPLYYADNLYINNELITELILSLGTTSIPTYGLACTNIKKLIIRDTSTVVQYNALDDSLEDLYIPWTEEEARAEGISNWGTGTDTNIHYNSIWEDGYAAETIIPQTHLSAVPIGEGYCEVRLSCSLSDVGRLTHDKGYVYRSNDVNKNIKATIDNVSSWAATIEVEHYVDIGNGWTDILNYIKSESPNSELGQAATYALRYCTIPSNISTNIILDNRYYIDDIELFE